MTEEELQPHIPKKIYNAQGQTLEAIYNHFVHGLNITESADIAGIHRQVAGRAIYAVRESLFAAGYEQVVKIVYQKADKRKKK